MSKLTIGTVDLPEFGAGECAFEIRAPARVLRGLVVHRVKPGLIVRRKEDPPVVPVPVLVVEFDPEAAPIEKRFVCLMPGAVFDTGALLGMGKRLEDVAVIVNPNNGQPMVVYEVLDATPGVQTVEIDYPGVAPERSDG